MINAEHAQSENEIIDPENISAIDDDSDLGYDEDDAYADEEAVDAESENGIEEMDFSRQDFSISDEWTDLTEQELQEFQ